MVRIGCEQVFLSFTARGVQWYRNFGLRLKTNVDWGETSCRGSLLIGCTVPGVFVRNLNGVVSHAWAECCAHVMSNPDYSGDRSVSTSPDAAKRGRFAR